jgi:hypothetical protein
MENPGPEGSSIEIPREHPQNEEETAIPQEIPPQEETPPVLSQSEEDTRIETVIPEMLAVEPPPLYNDPRLTPPSNAQPTNPVTTPNNPTQTNPPLLEVLRYRNILKIWRSEGQYFT